MSIASRLFFPVGQLVDRIVCVVLAVSFAQMPIYMNQYLNVLSGALTEARISYEDIEEKAAIFNLSVDEFIETLLSNEDEVVQGSGEIHQNTVKRYRSYQEDHKALKFASVWKKPIVFFSILDPELNAAVEFQPGVPVTSEGAVYALIGVILGLGVISLIILPFKLIKNRRSKRTQQPK